MPPTREGDTPNEALAGLTVAVDAPPEAVIGTTLTYHVTVANPTASTVSLTPCPSYQQLLTDGPFPVTERHRLNCDEASEIPARSQLRFEMRLPVPPAAAGATQLQWFPGWGAPGGQAPIAVTPPGDATGPGGCLPSSPEPPCGEGMTANKAYLVTAYPHCGFRELIADGRSWRPVAGTLEDNGNPPFGWGNPFDYGSAVLVAPDQLVYTASTGDDVPMRPAREDDPELAVCS